MDVIEIMARALWETREMCFPEKVRMSWSRGTDLARAATLRQAADLIAILPGAGYAIVPVDPSEDARAPYKAPSPIAGETHGDYIMRMAESFEQWANRK